MTGGGLGWLASGVSLISITLGTLYQRRYLQRDRLARRQISCNTLRSHFSGSGPGCSRACGALDPRSSPSRCMAGGGLSIDRSDCVLADPSLGRTSVASLFYLVPAVTR